MNLSVSNIAWDVKENAVVCRNMQSLGFRGLEIAPTKIFPERSYAMCKEAAHWSGEMRVKYGLSVISMQSIWYGMTQRIAGSPEEREQLYRHTVGAIQFALACGCHNLVFGSPRNRSLTTEADRETVEAFLLRIGQAAKENDVVIALEANPAMYHTNYLNTTEQTVRALRRLNNPALKLNLDLGAIIANGEDISFLGDDADLINHVHISEPGLSPLKRRKMHHTLRRILEGCGYAGFVSLEMGKPSRTEELYGSMKYLKEVFG